MKLFSDNCGKQFDGRDNNRYNEESTRGQNRRGGIFIKLDIEEALRYLGVKGPPSGELLRDMEAEADRLTASVQPRHVYRVFPVLRREEGIELQGSGVVLTGSSAAGLLKECDQAALLACTLGAGFDTLLRSTQARDMARAVMLDACGSAWVEAGCNQAEEELSARFPDLFLTDRFSPGYGDLPLALQGAVCAALDARRRLGIHVSESFLMNPTKSVTAVIGLAETPQPHPIRGCAACSMGENCPFRRGGKTCAS